MSDARPGGAAPAAGIGPRVGSIQDAVTTSRQASLDDVALRALAGRCALQAAGHRADCCGLIAPAAPATADGEQGDTQKGTEYRPGNSALGRACALSGVGLALS